ncbi:permease-like cell division protein FtsX [uncultured Holdemanella sp.]|uniref:permease-like cell division protein FtsX n=1 Tax=uncultured Holdemanella sp. TaxID=1763549 RepID=UPI0025DCE1D7|nr:permease-like cell division protein FtsX [uncultured Holdemanella sp.]
MLLFFKSLPRLVRSANKDMHRHFSMTFSSIVSIGIALLMALFIFVIYMNVGGFTDQIESEFMIQVSLNPTLEEDEIDELSNSISSLASVKKVTYSSKEDELNALIKENGAMFKQYKGEDKNPLYNVLNVELKDNSKISAMTKKISKMDGVVEATYGGSAISTMVQLFKNIRIWGSVFVGLMVFIAVFLIRNTIKMTILVRKDEIAIMRTVGAYNWYISFPFVLEGIFIGFWGALGPILICVFGYTGLYHVMNGMFFSDMMSMLNPYPFILYTALGILFMGMIVGMFGSYLAVRKYLRWTR